MLCYTCLKAKLEKKLSWAANADAAFTDRGYTNWKDATVRFSTHEASSCHKEALFKVIHVTLPASTTPDVALCISSQHQKDCLECRQCFFKLLSNVRFLAHQGLPLRGHGDESESNFTQLLRLRGEDDSRIEQWLKKRTDKYTSSGIQNEILTVMAKKVLHGLTTSIQSAPFISIMIDETTDKANKEQVVICFRWVDNELDVHKDFIGLYETESTEAVALLIIIHDVLIID